MAFQCGIPQNAPKTPTRGRPVGVNGIRYRAATAFSGGFTGTLARSFISERGVFMGDYFTDYGEAGVAARVAIHLVKKARRNPIVRARLPQDQVYYAITALEGVGFPMVRLALHSLAVHISLGGTSSEWLSGVLYRDLMRYTFRRCFHWDYKASRRLTPRITNRGGQLPLFADRLPLGEEPTDEHTKRNNVNTGDSGDRLDQRDATRRRVRLSDLDR